MKKDKLFYIKFSFLLIFFLATIHFPLIMERFEEIAEGFYGHFGILIFIAIWVLCFVALFATAILSNYYLRFFLAVPIIMASLSDSIHQKISGHEINYDIVQLLWESRYFANDAFSLYKGEIVVPILIVIFGIIGIFLQYKDIKKHHFKLTFACAIAPYPVILLLILAQGGFGTGGLPFQYKTSSLFAMMLINNAVVTQQRIESRISIPIEKSRFGPFKPNILLIIDESVRADFLDINRNTGTTPSLLAQKERLVNFGYAGSGANCSQTSNQIIRVGANGDPDKFNDSLKNNPYIWQYAKQAGYKTIMVDSQVSQKKKNNRLGNAEIAMIDNFYFIEGIDSREKDINAGRLIKKILSEQNKEKPYFIFFIKMGVHFPYEERYPQNARKFIPDRKIGDPLDNIETLINSYKNVLLWVTDSAFADLLNDNEENFQDSIIIYTSDHGQSLLDNGNKLSHCSTKDVSIYEGLVPLFILTDNQEWKGIFNKSAMQNKDKASHFNIIPTILDIFGYSSSQRMVIHGKSLLDELQGDRNFISGFITLDRLRPFSTKNKIQWHTLPVDLKSQE